MSLRLQTAEPSFLIDLDGAVVNIAMLSGDKAISLRDHLRQVGREQDSLKVDAVLSYGYTRIADSTIRGGARLQFFVPDAELLARESAYLTFIAAAQRYSFVMKHEGDRVSVEAYAKTPKNLGQQQTLKLVWWVLIEIAPRPVLPEL